MSWDGKIYDKYRIEHTDGTPLKGKKYFVLRLDSDDPVEAARVAVAMLAYKGKPRNCDIGTAEEQAERMDDFCARHGERIGCSWRCDNCPLCSINRCDLVWAQMPYVEKEGGDR